MEKRLHIETWGCQMNRHDAEMLAGVFAQAGFCMVDALKDADVVLFVGCMVRQKAEEKVYGRIGAIVEEKRQRSVLLGVGGCLGQVRGESLLKRFPAIDFVYGSQGFDRLPALVEQVARSGERVLSSEPSPDVAEAPVVRANPVTAMVTISEGCSNFCSYCVVPYARGPMRSRSPERILGEVERAVADGYREVLLLGQNVNSYGRDHAAFGDFVSLLRRVSQVGPERIRFTSSHPRDVTDALFEVMADLPNVMPHIHAACQSGSDAILAAMNRGATRARLLKMVERAREIVPGINFTTDLIVGFPGETASDFDDTLDLVDRGRFGSIFVAKYSPRPGTRSAELTDSVSDSEKSDRLHRVLDRQRAIALEENGRMIGKEIEVLVEGTAADGVVFGRSPDHRTVTVAADGEPGETLGVRVTGATAGSLCGDPLVAMASNPRGKESP